MGLVNNGEIQSFSCDNESCEKHRDETFYPECMLPHGWIFLDSNCGRDNSNTDEDHEKYFCGPKCAIEWITTNVLPWYD